MLHPRHSAAVAIVLPVLLAAASGCDMATAHFRAEESAEWRKTYDLPAGGRVEVRNVNGRIEVLPSSERTVEVVAVKTGRGPTADAAREALAKIEIAENVGADVIRIETKLPRGAGFFSNGGEVRYTVKVPASAVTEVITVNGGVEVIGLSGRVRAETTNGGIVGRDVSGSLEATTTNGGIDVDLARVAEGGVSLECTNGAIKVRLPGDARATISASVANGGIDTGGLSLETTDSSRRRLEARLNGGGPSIRLEGTNGGIQLTRR
jgi:Putative adhesin